MGNSDRKTQEKRIRREDILKSAEHIFLRKGYDDTTMDEIASAAEYTKRTIYQYFPAKEDIYFALASRIFDQLVGNFAPIASMNVSGFEKLQKAGEEYIRFYVEHTDQFLIMIRSRKIRVRDEGRPSYQALLLQQQRLFDTFGAALADGMKDGSIRKDIDIRKITFFVVASMVSLFSELAEDRKGVDGAVGMTLPAFMAFSSSMFLESLRPR